MRLKGPEGVVPVDSVAFVMTIDKQPWEGVYVGDGIYAVRYAPKAPAVLPYTISSDKVKELDGVTGVMNVGKYWPGKLTPESYRVGPTWWTDCLDPDLFDGKWQGFKTTSCWRNDVLDDWAKRLNLLKK
ncbi:MAG: DUF5060 domain-containing protein [Muribaculaceae bacterium]|nr:DUF5060 domain-containing protein [Muribaculaceae bacterium]